MVVMTMSRIEHMQFDLGYAPSIYFTLCPRFSFVSHSLYISWFQTGSSESISHPARNRKHLKSQDKKVLCQRPFFFLRIQIFGPFWTGAHTLRGVSQLNQPSTCWRAHSCPQETHCLTTVREQCVVSLAPPPVFPHEHLTVTF